MSERLPRKQKAYVLICVQPGKEVELYEELKQIPSILGIDLVHGPFDFIVVAEGNASGLDKAVLSIRKSRHILSIPLLSTMRGVLISAAAGDFPIGPIVYSAVFST